MKIFTQKILKTGILGFFVLLILFTPISASIQSNLAESGLSESSISFEMNITHAASWFGIDDIAGAAWEGLIAIIGTTMLTLASMVTFLGGKLLDESIKSLVIGMGDIVNGIGLGTGIDIAWKMIRDICNLAFIFGFIYAGISTILDPHGESAKRFISKIIIGALLINFSLFFVKVIIDFANFTSVQIYNAILSGDSSISSIVMNQLGLVTIFHPTNGEVLLKVSGSFTFYAMASLFLIITGFVFAASALMLITRFVTLIFIMVCSPILFAATVFPQTEKYAKDMWSKLLSSAFFVPIYLILTLISISLLSNINLSGKKDWVDAFTNTGDANTYAIILQFCIIIFFMIQSLLIANKFSLMSSDVITTKTRALVGGATIGLAAKAGRATAGRLGNYVSESEGLKDSASQGGLKGWSARQVLKGSRVAGDASFDARNTGVGKSLEMGSGRKGGWVSAQKEINEKEEKFAKSLGEVGDNDILVEARKKEMEAKKKNHSNAKEDLIANKKELSNLKIKLNKAILQGDINTSTSLQADIDELQKSVVTDEEHLEHIEHDAHDAEIKYASEKQRRILGSTYSKAPDAVEAEIKILKEGSDGHGGIKGLEKEIKNQWKEYQTAGDTRKKELRDLIKTNKSKIKKSKEDIHTLNLANKEMGYAGVQENASVLTSLMQGRLASQNRGAGKAMRKAHQNGIPKAQLLHAVVELLHHRVGIDN